MEALHFDAIPLDPHLQSAWLEKLDVLFGHSESLPVLISH